MGKIAAMFPGKPGATPVSLKLVVVSRKKLVEGVNRGKLLLFIESMKLC